MNIAEQMEIEAGLKKGLACWMESHGEVLYDKSRSNAYVGVRIRGILWQGIRFRIVDVDGMTCEISRV